jgi:hypothetical protein
MAEHFPSARARECLRVVGEIDDAAQGATSDIHGSRLPVASVSARPRRSDDEVVGSIQVEVFAVAVTSTNMVCATVVPELPRLGFEVVCVTVGTDIAFAADAVILRTTTITHIARVRAVWDGRGTASQPPAWMRPLSG